MEVFKYLKNVSSLLTFLFFAFTISIPTAAATYHFSSEAGNDSRLSILAQSPNTPWKTIDKLNQVMNNLSPGDSVLFKRDEVFYGQIQITKSGNASSPIIFGAYGEGHKPVITSLIKLEGWSAVGNGVYESNMKLDYDGPVNIVTIDGIIQELGRYPNFDEGKKGYLNIESTSNNSSIGSSELKGSTNWSGGEIVIRKNPWIIDRHLISGNSGSQINYAPIQSGYNAAVNYGFFIQNHLSTLDQFGEWYFNENTQKLFVFFGNENPENHKVMVSNYSNLIDFDWGRSYITFTELDFQGANQTGIKIQSGTNVRILNSELSFIGEYAIFGVLSHDLEVANCKIIESLNNGISIENATKNVTITNNEFRNTFRFNGMGKNSDLNGLAIYTSGTSDNGLIENNQIFNTGYIAINFGGNNTIVKNNLIDNFCVHKSDGGGIYTWEGPDNRSLSNRIIEGNIIINGIGYSEGTPNLVNINLPPIEGIYLDDNSSGILIKNNTIANIVGKGVYFHNARNIILENNIFYNNSEHVNFKDDNSGDPIKNVKVENNTFFSVQPYQNFIKMVSTNGTDFNGMSQFNNNFYVNPFGNKFGVVEERIYSGNTTNQILDLHLWGKDPKFNYSPHKLSYFNSFEILEDNLFENKGFDQDVANTFCNGCTRNRKTGDEFNGGYLYVSAKKGNSLGLFLNAPSNEKYYILSFHAKVNKKAGVELKIQKDGNPWTQMSRPFVVEISEEKTAYEMAFYNKIDVGKAVLYFISTTDDLLFSIDDIQFREAEIDFYNRDDLLFFEYNYSNNTKKFPLIGTYVDAKNNSFSGSIDIAPFSSVALIKVSDENLGKPEPPTISIIHPSVATELEVGQKLKIELEAKSCTSGIEKIELYLNEILIQKLDTLPYEFEHLFDKEGAFILKAKAIDKNGLETYSESININVKKAVTAPIISWISPSDNDFFFISDSIQLSVFIKKTEQNIRKIDFSINDIVVGSVYNEPYQITVKDLPMGRHQIIAKAINDAGLEGNTEVIHITVVAQEISFLTSPILLAPSDGSIDLSGSLPFTWTIPENSDLFRIQIAQDRDFKKILYDLYNLPTATFDVNNLDPGLPYFWRVSASNEAGSSDFSETWKFETLSLPESPTLVSPSNGKKD